MESAKPLPYCTPPGDGQGYDQQSRRNIVARSDFAEAPTIWRVDNLSPKNALGTFAEGLERPAYTGLFGNYLYCLKTGVQVVLHVGYEPDYATVAKLKTVQIAFMSKNTVHQLRPVTWEAMRELLADGYKLGTEKRPGLSVTSFFSGRGLRRPPETIFVFPRPDWMMER
jgi:hypothetical protein